MKNDIFYFWENQRGKPFGRGSKNYCVTVKHENEKPTTARGKRRAKK